MCSLPSCLLIFCTHYFNSRCVLQVSSLQLLQAYQQHHFMGQGVQPSTKKVIEPNFDESDRKSNCDEDEITQMTQMTVILT